MIEFSISTLKKGRLINYFTFSKMSRVDTKETRLVIEA